MKQKLLIGLFVLLAASFSFAQTGEQAPIVERAFEYKDWVYKNIATDRDMNLRKFVNGKKLVMVTYFSPWCPNWKTNVAFVQKMYEKYKSQGFDVIAVGEYASVDAMKKHVADYKLAFPVVWESDSQAARLTTTHYQQRQAAGDTRKWGSPWYVFLEGAKVEPAGNVFTRKTAVVNGELIEAEAEKYIREKLGLEKKALIEACDPKNSETAKFVKP